MKLTEPKLNFQVYPSKLRVVPNDRTSKKLFNLTADDLIDWIERQKTMNFIEILQHRKFGEILSPIKLTVDDESFTISEPIDLYDLAVASVCISEKFVGNMVTTPTIIYRGLTGKIGKNHTEPSKDQLNDIFNSVNKLMRLQIDYNMTDLCQKVGYNDGNPFHLVSMFLPCHYLKATTINGKDASVIYFDNESPIYLSAQIKNNQLLTYDNSLYDVPHMQNTRTIIKVKFYVLNRITEITLHKKMVPILTFTDIFDKCYLDNVDRKTKLRVREIIVTFLEHLKSKDIVNSFELTKKGNAFHSIKFTYSKPQK